MPREGGIERRVARFSPRFVGQHAVAQHVVVGQTDGIGQAHGQPDRHVPPEWLFDINMRVLELLPMLPGNAPWAGILVRSV